MKEKKKKKVDLSSKNDPRFPLLKNRLQSKLWHNLILEVTIKKKMKGFENKGFTG